MTAAVQRSTPSLSIPQTQNTAPVFEFNCLYTHDIRRKQKRWQDGFLRYHTFNKRVMVYDVPRNFLGDLHWTEGAHLQEGDEMMLEKSAILVQVAEQVGRTETDLSELLQRKDKPSPAKQLDSPNRSMHQRVLSRPQTATPRAQASPAQAHAKHKSLNSLLGPKRGLIGKAALPDQSPFEQRASARAAQDHEADREAQRQRASVRSRASTEMSDKPQKPLRLPEVIDLSSDNEQTPGAANHAYSMQMDFPTSSPVRLTDTSKNAHRVESRNSAPLAAGPFHAKQPTCTPEVAESPSVRQLQRKRPPPGVAGPSAKRVRQPSPVRPNAGQEQIDALRQKSPPVRTANTASADQAQPSESPFFPSNAESQRQGKSLKLGGSAPRRMLVFQDQANKATSRQRQQSIENRGQSEEDGGAGKGKGQPTKITVAGAGVEEEEQEEPQSIHRKRLQERLARINKKQKVSESSLELYDAPKQKSPPSVDVAPRRPIAAAPTPRVRRGSDSSIEEALPAPVAIQNQQDKSGSSLEKVLPAPVVIQDEEDTRSPSTKEVPPAPVAIQNQQAKRGSSTFLHPHAQESATSSNDQRKRNPPSPPLAPPSNATKSMPPPPPPAHLPTNRKPTTKQRPTYNVQSDGPTTAVLGKPFKAPSARPVTRASTTATATETQTGAGSVSRKAIAKPTQKDGDLGPWSTEAFDLMDWRPRDRDVAGDKAKKKESLGDVQDGVQNGGKDEDLARGSNSGAVTMAGLSGGVDAPRLN